jgi:hypothetical protein
MPPLTEAAVANRAISFGLCPTPEYALAYPAICPLILLDEILSNVGRFGVRGRRWIIAHLRFLPDVALNGAISFGRAVEANIGVALAAPPVLPYVNPMPRSLIFDSEHADYLVQLLNESLSNDELAARMSRQFKVRITAAHIQRLLSRMRSRTDPIYRAAPYRKAGSRFSG